MGNAEEREIEIVVNGRVVRSLAGSTVAAALLGAGVSTFRRSVRGDPRGPLCGMGICYECRVTIDGVPQQRACLVPITTGMTVTTDA
jgi:sarcosine oxidase subunit alpha